MKKILSIITGLVPLIASAQLVMNNSFYVVMAGGTQANPTSLVLTNATPAGITNNGSGWIVSENEFNQVDWAVGTNTGTYVVPFGYSTTDYLPVTCDITGAGVGAGVIKFATYHGATWQNSNYKPSGVGNLATGGLPDDSRNMVDRFWIADASGFTTNPSPTLKFTYIRSGAANEVAAPNTITESQLVAQRFSVFTGSWNGFAGTPGTDVTNANTGTVSSGAVSANNFFRAWALVKDTTALGVNEVVNADGAIVAWPNPATITLNVKFGAQMEGDAEISVSDVTGRQLVIKNLHISSGMVLPLDIANLPVGMYFLRVNANNYLSTAKFIKQ